MMRVREAEQAYRQAFDEFAKQAQHVQVLTAQSYVDAKVLEAALLELERAHVNYDLCRDQWVQFLLPSGIRDSVFKSASDVEHSHEDCVRTIAELLWKNSGRPEGTAHEDWRKAEEIVRQAAAGAVAA